MLQFNLCHPRSQGLSSNRRWIEEGHGNEVGVVPVTGLESCKVVDDDYRKVI